MIRTTCRTAQRRHVCETCSDTIEPGDRYLEHVASPNHDDLGNTGWWRLTECAGCAEVCGRGRLLQTTDEGART